MRKKSAAPSSNFFIQPWWKVVKWCQANSLGPPATRPIDTKIFELIREKRLGLDSFAYYLYKLCPNQLLQRWAAAEQEDLSISAETIKRMRAELRAVGLLTTVRLGVQTYTVVHQAVLDEQQQKSLFRAARQALQNSWLVSKRQKVAHDTRAVVDMIRLTAVPTSFNRAYIFRRPLLFALQNLWPKDKGVTRLKAVGLWIYLQHAGGPNFNWKGPDFITKDTDLASSNTIRKLCLHLRKLGLLFYCRKRNSMAVSLFPFGRWEHLHPLNNEYFQGHRPWIYFRFEATDSKPDVWERKTDALEETDSSTADHKLTAAENRVLGVSRQLCKVSTENAKKWAQMEAEVLQNEYRLTGDPRWNPTGSTADAQQRTSLSEMDLQAYLEGLF